MCHFIATCKHKVRGISTEQCNLGPEGVAAIAEFLEDDASIESLNIHLNACGVEGAASLSQALRHNSKMTSLNVSSNIIGDDGVTRCAVHLVPSRARS